MPTQLQNKATEIAIPELMNNDSIYMPSLTLHELFIRDAEKLFINHPLKNQQAPSLEHRYLQTICLQQTTVANTYVVGQPPELGPDIPFVTGVYKSSSDDTSLTPVTLKWFRKFSDSKSHLIKDDYDEQGQLIAKEVWYYENQPEEGPMYFNLKLMRQADGTFEKTWWHARNRESSSILQIIKASPASRSESLKNDLLQKIQTISHIRMQIDSTQNCSYKITEATRLSPNQWTGCLARLEQTSIPPIGQGLFMNVAWFIMILFAAQFPLYIMKMHSITLGLLMLVPLPIIPSYYSNLSYTFKPLKYCNDRTDELATQVLKKLHHMFYQGVSETHSTVPQVTLSVYNGNFANPLKPLFEGEGILAAYAALKPTDRLATTPNLGEVIELRRDTRTYRMQIYRNNGFFKNNVLTGPVVTTYDGRQWKQRIEDNKRSLLNIGKIYLLSNMDKPLALDIQLTRNAHYCCQIEEDLSYFINNSPCGSVYFFSNLIKHGTDAHPFIKQIGQQLNALQVQQLHQQITKIITPELLRLLPRPLPVLSTSLEPLSIQPEPVITTRADDSTPPIKEHSVALNEAIPSKPNANPILDIKNFEQTQQRRLEEELRRIKTAADEKARIEAEKVTQRCKQRKPKKANHPPVVVHQCPVVVVRQDPVVEKQAESMPPEPERPSVKKQQAKPPPCENKSIITTSLPPAVQSPSAWLKPLFSPLTERKIYANNPYASPTESSKTYYPSTFSS